MRFRYATYVQPMSPVVADTKTYENWVPVLQDQWFVGDRQSWEIPEDLQHPALGLTYEQLTATLDGAEILPAAWDRTGSQELALAAQSVLSRQIGGRNGLRHGWGNLMRSFVSAVMSARAGQPVVFADFAAAFPAFLEDRRWGWGSGPSGFERLYRLAAARGGIPHAGPASGELILPDSPIDFRALDRAWTWTRSAGGTHQSYLPLLPIEVISCFAPTRRPLAVDGVEDPVLTPALIEIVAAALVLGAADMTARGDRLLDLEVLRPAAKRRNRREGSGKGLSAAALSNTRSAAGSMNSAMQRAALAVPQLQQRWVHLDPLQPLDKEVRGRVNITDRTAVPLTVARHARAQLVAKVDRLRPKAAAQVRQGSDRRNLGYTRALRYLIVLDLAGQMGLRPNEGPCMLKVAHFDVQHVFSLPEGQVTCPAMLFTSSKAIPIAPYWRPIHPETAALISKWTEWMGLQATDWLFPADDPSKPWPIRQVSAGFVGSKVIPLPDGSGGYELGRLRHMVEALAYGVGSDYIAAHTQYSHKVSPQVFSDAMCGHVMSQDKLGYKDLEHNRELWAFRAAMGDPVRGVPGVIDMIMGEAGARRGWDIAAIRSALRAQQSAQTRLNDARAEHHAAERQLGRFAARLQGVLARHAPTPSATTDIAQVLAMRDAYDHELRQAMHDKEAAHDARDRTRERVADAERDLDRSATQLKALSAAGTTLLLPDDLSNESQALERESWEEALERADGVRASAAAQITDPADTVVTRTRAHLNLQEFAGVADVTDRAVRGRYDEPADELVTITARLRCIAVDRLPASVTDRMTQAQHELMNQMLMVEMGSTRWGGPHIDNARIRAAEQAR